MIQIKTVTFKNILKVGNRPITFDFESHKKTIITGANGAGKSVILDVIVYALFGKPFRKIKKPGLINTTNKRDMEVLIHLRIKDTDYHIKRGMAPNIFEIYANGTLIAQDSTTKDYQKYLEEEILNMNYETFTQIVILGDSNYVPFMRMGAQSRREIIEDILNISIFSRMNELLKLDVKDKEVSLQLKEKEKELTKKQYSFLYERFNQNKISTADRLDSKQESILKYESDLFTLKQSKEDLLEEIKPLPYNKTDLEIQKKKLDTFRIKIESNLTRTIKEMNFYNENTSCSKCNSELTEEHKIKYTSILNESKEKFELALIELNSRINSLDIKIIKVKEITANNLQVNNKLKALDSGIANLVEKINYICTEIKDISKESKEVIKEEEIEALKLQLQNVDGSMQAAHHTLDILKKGQHVLKDTGAKTRIINFYLPMINNTINMYLEKFNFSVLFAFNENFEESFKARNIDTYTYGNFSEGEKLRIDLSILFAFREIAKKKNSASVNLLFFDELLDSSMDVTGIEHFFEVINECVDDVNFVIISHREGVDAFFDRHLVASKSSNFTEYKQQSS